MLKEIDKYLLPNDNVLETITNHRQKEFEELEALEKEICKNRQRIREFVENFRLPKFKYPGIDEYLRELLAKQIVMKNQEIVGKVQLQLF